MSEEFVKRYRLDSRGHKITSDFHPLEFVRVQNIGEKLLKELSAIDDQYQLAYPFVLDHLFSCGWCDAYPGLEYGPDGESVRMKSDCQWSGGITSVNEFVVTSGKVIVTDDLRPVYSIPDGISDSFASYNSALGQHQMIEAMAKIGCAYGPVGNSCPSLYQTFEGSYVIARSMYNEDTDEEILLPGWVKLAWICTDLWAYSLADFEDWKAKGGEYRHGDHSKTVVSMPPGRYEVTHHSNEADFDRDADGVVFAHIDLVAEEKGN